MATKAKAKAEPEVEVTPPVVLRADLRARDVRDFELELTEIPIDRVLTRWSLSYAMVALKGAIGAGWVEAPETSKRTIIENGSSHAEYLFDGVSVDDLEPLVVFQAGQAVRQLYESFTVLDPK